MRSRIAALNRFTRPRSAELTRGLRPKYAPVAFARSDTTRSSPSPSPPTRSGPAEEHQWYPDTERYRYTEWLTQEKESRGTELYDYQEDPLETRNLVDKPEAAELVKELRTLLETGWRTALPEGITAPKT